MDRNAYLDYARGALAILEANLRSYYVGRVACYRVIAVQLRLLLCDTNRVHDRIVDISVVPRLYPHLTLDPVQVAAVNGVPGATVLIFQGGTERLPLQEWLEQKVVDGAGRPVSLRDLIRRVCEQDGGAHVDPRALRDLRAWAERDTLVASLGEYVLAVLRPLLAEDSP